MDTKPRRLMGRAGSSELKQRSPGRLPPPFVGSIPPKGANPDPSPLLTILGVAKHCGCGPRHIQNEIKLGRLRVLKLGRLVRVDPRDLDEYLSARKVGGLVPIRQESSARTADAAAERTS